MSWIYVYISASVLIVAFALLFFIGRKSRHYTGDKSLEERLKSVGYSLVGNKLDADGIVFIISEYWQVFETEGRKAVFTRFEYYYDAPLLRYFHVAKRPREEIINHAHSHSVDIITTGNAVFDSFYTVRTQTGSESISLLTENIMSFMIESAENTETEMELFDNYALMIVSGKPEYIATDVFVDVVKKFSSFARSFENARKANPLPPVLTGIYEQITANFGDAILRKSDEGGSDIHYSLPSGRKVIFTLRAGNDGIQVRFPLLDDSAYIFALCETSYPMQFPTEKYDIRLFSGENFKNPTKKFKILQISDKSALKSNQNIKGFMAGKRRRMYQIYFQHLTDAGFFAEIEKVTAETERICKRWSGDKIPSVEFSNLNLRIYIPGPITPKVQLSPIIDLFDELATNYLSIHGTISETIV